MENQFLLRTSTTELDANINRKGGLFYPPEGETPAPLLVAIHKRLADLRDWAERELYEKRPKPLEFGLICSSQLNAFAYTSRPEDPNKLDFIGLNIGAIATFHNTFNRILSRPESFPHVGNPKLEMANRETIPFLSTDIFTHGFSFQSPNCPVRAYFAGELAQLATEFLFLHELGHLRNGHVDFVRNKLAFDHLPEAFDGNNKRNENLIWQTLEFDADAAGLVLIASQIHMRFRIVSSGHHHPIADLNSAFQSLYGTFESALQSLSYSVYIAFRLFNLSEWSWVTQPNFSHPSELFRMGSIAPLFYELLTSKPIYNSSPDDYMRRFGETVKYAEVDCGLIQGTDPDPSGIIDFISSSQRLVYLEQLKACWIEIRPFLNAYVRGGNLAL